MEHILISISLLLLTFQNLTFAYPGTGPFLISSRYQPFPNSGHPGALVYFPSNFDFSSESLDIAVYIHGWSNCIENCILPRNNPISCTSGQPKRGSYDLITQLENSKVDAMLLLIEVEYDQQSSNAGNFVYQNQFYYYMEDVLANISSSFSNQMNVSTINRMIIFSHSGGYETLACIATLNPQFNDSLKELVLLDSLYGEFADYDQWFQQVLPNLGLDQSQFRFNNIYTDFGGTNNNSIAQEQRFRNWLEEADMLDQLYWDNTYQDLPPSVYTNSSVIFKRTKLAHDLTPLYYFQPFVSASFSTSRRK